MSAGVGDRGTAVVVAAYDRVPLARATVRTALERGHLDCLVVDLDGRYVPLGAERVVTILQLASGDALRQEATTAAATLDADDLHFYAAVLGAGDALARGSNGVVVLGAGVLVLDDLRPFVATPAALTVVPGADAVGAKGRAAADPANLRRDVVTGLLTLEGPAAGALCSRSLFAVRTGDPAERLRQLAGDWRVAATALDRMAVAAAAALVTEPSVLVSPWRSVGETSVDDDLRLCVDGARVTTVDLTQLDPGRPWIMDARAPTRPRVLLSEHPVLAEIVRTAAEGVVADEQELRRLGHPQGADVGDRPGRTHLDVILRTEARRAERAGGDLPDVLGLGTGADLTARALALVPAGDPRPVARYLAAVRLARTDLQSAFPEVPGPDAARLARWATRAGVGEVELDAELLDRAAAVTLEAQPPKLGPAKGRFPQGVNLVGYLAGELGLGESARLVDSALQSVGIPTSTWDVSDDVESRRTAAFRRSEPVVHGTSLICLNGAETAAAAPRLGWLIKRTRVVGMWYWELEELPPAYRAGLQYVDEVWAASDFMRDAIAEHAGDVPVRTVTPPLPQAGADPGVVPAEWGIPTDRPWLLFTFDFLSMAERKNPYGLVEAFTRAFGELPLGARPLLVIKTINADRCPVDAERLRLQIAGRGDIVFLDAYLDNDERHVLVSHCSAYVSLHKAEGLGLTVAEAMAWGRPVITTAYGGVMQFCNAANAFLVDWAPGHVAETTGPYVKGMRWAEPDLDHAAELMRLVVAEPGRAETVGARAASDIRQLHNAEVAGARMRAVLEEGDAHWTGRGEARGRPPEGATPSTSAPDAAKGIARRLAGRLPGIRPGGTSRPV